MDILRNLFGNLTSGIIRLLVTVGILAAAYFFIVKPALDTTRDISKEVNTSIGNSLGKEGLGDIRGTIEDVNRQVQREIRRSFRAAKRHGGSKSDRLINCIQRAQGDVNKIQRCTRRY